MIYSGLDQGDGGGDIFEEEHDEDLLFQIIFPDLYSTISWIISYLFRGFLEAFVI